MYESFHNCVELLGPWFKYISETAVHEATHEDTHEVALAKLEGRKKLLTQIIFEIDGLSDDEAIFILQALAKDDDQLIFFFIYQITQNYAFVVCFKQTKLINKKHKLHKKSMDYGLLEKRREFP